MEAKLTVIDGKASKGEVRIKLPAVIGRSRQAGLILEHPLVSRRHCEIFERDGQVFVRDFGSANGTFLDAKRVAQEGVPVAAESVLTVGPLKFRVELRSGKPRPHDATRRGAKTERAPTAPPDDAPPAAEQFRDDRSVRTKPASPAHPDTDVILAEESLLDTVPADSMPVESLRQTAALADLPPPADDDLDFDLNLNGSATLPSDDEEGTITSLNAFAVDQPVEMKSDQSVEDSFNSDDPMFEPVADPPVANTSAGADGDDLFFEEIASSNGAPAADSPPVASNAVVEPASDSPSAASAPPPSAGVPAKGKKKKKGSPPAQGGFSLFGWLFGKRKGGDSPAEPAQNATPAPAATPASSTPPAASVAPTATPEPAPAPTPPKKKKKGPSFDFVEPTPVEPSPEAAPTAGSGNDEMDDFLNQLGIKS